MKEELIELQTRIAFQENVLEEMNLVVIRQQNQIDGLIAELKVLREQYITLAEPQLEGGQINDDKPPHY